MPNIKVRSNKQFEKIKNKIDNFASEAVSAVKNEIDPNSATLAGAISASAVDSVREYLDSDAETLDEALENVITEIAEQVVPSGSGEGSGNSGSLSGNLKDLTYETKSVNGIKFRFEDGKVYHLKSSGITMYDGDTSPVYILQYNSNVGSAIQSLDWIITSINGNTETVLRAYTGSLLNNSVFYYRDGIGWKKYISDNEFADLTSEQEELFYFTLYRSSIKDADSLANIVTEDIPENDEVIAVDTTEISLGETLNNIKKLPYEIGDEVEGLLPNPDIELLLKLYTFDYSDLYIYGNYNSDYIRFYNSGSSYDNIDSSYSYLTYYNSAENKSYNYYYNYESLPSNTWIFNGEKVDVPELDLDVSKINNEIAFNCVYGNYRETTTFEDKINKLEDSISNGAALKDQVYDTEYSEEEDDMVDITLETKFNRVNQKFNEEIKNWIYEKASGGASPVFDVLSEIMKNGQIFFSAGLTENQNETILYQSPSLMVDYSYNDSRGMMIIEWIKPVQTTNSFDYYICQISMPNTITWNYFNGPWKEEITSTPEMEQLNSQEDMPLFEDFDSTYIQEGYEDVMPIFIASSGSDTTVEEKINEALSEKIYERSTSTIEAEDGDSIKPYDSIDINSFDGGSSLYYDEDNNVYIEYHTETADRHGMAPPPPYIGYSINGNSYKNYGSKWIDSSYNDVTDLPSFIYDSSKVDYLDGLKKVCPISVTTTNETSLSQKFDSISQFPACPTDTDGTFVLKATVSDGTVTYAWVQETNN